MDDSEAPAISGESLLPLGNIKALENETELERLKPAAVTGIGILNDLAAAFEKAKAVPEIAELNKSIDEIAGRLQAGRVIIGVVGTTGAGKSSVINAILDEEFLVPTNGMRACTAVITEIQYNKSADEATKYRAEVEFISDFRSGAKNEYKDPNTDAGIAYSKMRAIFPHLTVDDIRSPNTSAESMASHESLTGVLDSSTYVAASGPQALLDQVQLYIDSSDKFNVDPSKMEYWPLVKVVKIFVRNPILETGLVIVDLPGVQDTNAVRSAVASKYIQHCSGLWVVAPITRAVDDKTAHDLLGPAFRRQMQLDGAYGNMSFICSKIDDITITEAMKSIKKDDPRHSAHSRYQALQNVQESIKSLAASSRTAEMNHRNLLDRLKDLELSKNRITDALLEADDMGEVFLLTPSPVKKRKARESAETPRKRTQPPAISDSDTCNEDSESDNDGDSVGEPEVDVESETLTRQEARRRAEEIKEEKKALDGQKKESNSLRKVIKSSLKEAKAEKKRLEAHLKSDCIQFRNEYSVDSIRRQFAEGVREMDQDTAIYDDEENFDPNEDVRDYRALAGHLPVFCVSSKAYQKMSGRLVKDENVEGFPNLADTGIPGLQNHALKIIESTRVVVCQRFLNELRRYLMSLMMKVVISKEPLKLAAGMRQQELDVLEEAVGRLSMKCDDSISNTFEICRRKAKSRIYKKFDGAVRTAFDEATKIVAIWGDPKEEKGMRYQTYRATTARNGVFKGSNGPRDLNEELTDPLKKEIAKAWESVCTRHIPDKVKDLGSELVEHMGSFTASMNQRPALQQSKSYGLVLEKLSTFEKSLGDTTPMIDLAMEGQKEANRVFTRAIARAMVRAYAKCRAESGIGSYARMKDHVSERVETERSKMYANATERAKEGLDKMLDELQDNFKDQVAHIVAVVREDFTTLVADRNTFKALGDVSKKVELLLVAADLRFDHFFHTQHEVIVKSEDVDENMPERMGRMSIDMEGAAAFPVNGDALGHQTEMES
ncbi:hypothetical protein QBC39DRAFT_393544 [Podospora conica]|nr:hypothetical protein QBC39DRAFT_393544 [Schizothecium conicum]